MRKYLVPIDFSETSKNAARYAVKMAAETENGSIALFHVYDAISAGSDGSLLRETDDDARKQISLAALNNLRYELLSLANVPIECIAEEGKLTTSLDKLFHQQELDLIVMGITGATRLDQILMGSNTLRVVAQNMCPVMIIPPEASYRSVKTVVFCTDFKDVAVSTPIKALRTLLHMFKPELHVVHVNPDHQAEKDEPFLKEKAKLESMLAGYSPKFSFISTPDFVHGINEFASLKHADMIITVPRRHSFLSALFKPSHTQKLAYHSHIPVLAVHE